MDEGVPEGEAVAAVLDIGTNSVLLLVALRGPDGRIVTLAEGMRITRLGDGLADNGRLRPEAIARTEDACRAFLEAARRHGAEHIVGVGTEAARAAANAAELRERIEAAGISSFRVLDPADEARLSYAGVRSGLRLRGVVAVADIGGGSTELVVGEGDDVRAAVSVPVGCLRTPLGPPGDDPVRIEAARRRLAAAIDPVVRSCSPSELIGVGGTVTTCAAIEGRVVPYAARRIQGARLARTAVAALSARLRGMSGEERRQLPGMAAGRETSLVAGLELLDQVLASTGTDGLRVSTRGLRHGVLAQRWFGAGASASPDA